jgi:O-antigen ligase
VRHDPKHMVVTQNEIVALAPYLSNRSMAVAVFLFWPVFGLLFALLPRHLDRPWLTAGALSIAAALSMTVFLSQHETSTIALIVGAAMFAIAVLWRQAAITLSLIGIILAVALVVPMASLAYPRFELQKASWLPRSAQERIVLWYYTAQQVPKSPLLGVGATSTEVLDMRRGEIAKLPGDPIPLRSGRHAHNVYLQVWYELGAIGAALLLIFGIGVVGAIRHIQLRAQSFALAAFASSAAIAATSWSLWQEWFLANFAMAAVLCALLSRVYAASPANRPQSWSAGSADEDARISTAASQ